jgi:hypothetical protein
MKTIVAAAAFATFVAAQANDGDAVRDRLDKYLIEYEPQLSSLVADERMTQRDGASRLANARTAEPTKDREIISEVAFVGLPGNVGWLGFRRVIKVNNKTIADSGPSLGVLLTDGAKDDYDQARLLLGQSAEHNLGFPRTTNLPNLPLEFLHRDEFIEKYGPTEQALPAVFLKKGEELELWITADEINRCSSVGDLKRLISARLASVSGCARRGYASLSNRPMMFSLPSGRSNPGSVCKTTVFERRLYGRTMADRLCPSRKIASDRPALADPAPRLRVRQIQVLSRR